MANYKCTGIFNGNNAGWTETYVCSAANAGIANNSFNNLMTIRLGMLGTAYQLAYIRITEIDPPSLSQLFFIGQYGWGADTGDTPWQSALFRVVGALGQRRMLALRGVPDAQVTGAVLRLTGSFASAVSAFASALTGGIWQIRGVDHSQPMRTTVSVDTGGNAVTTVAHGWAVGDLVKPYRTRGSGSRTLRGPFPVLATPTTTTALLGNWPAGISVGVGYFRKYVLTYSAIGGAAIIRVSLRKVGRPFGLYRGRQRRRA